CSVLRPELLLSDHAQARPISAQLHRKVVPWLARPPHVARPRRPSPWAGNVLSADILDAYDSVGFPVRMRSISRPVECRQQQLVRRPGGARRVVPRARGAQAAIPDRDVGEEVLAYGLRR